MCGLLGGSSIDMLPWNLAWPFGFSEEGREEVGDSSVVVDVDVVTGGMKSRCARENPPMSASDIILQSSIEEASWKDVRIYGFVACLVPSALRAVRGGSVSRCSNRAGSRQESVALWVGELRTNYR